MDDFLPETSSRDPSALLHLMLEEEEEEEDEQQKRQRRDDILCSQMKLASLLTENKNLQPRPKQEKTCSCKKDWSLRGIDKDGKVFLLTALWLWATISGPPF